MMETTGNVVQAQWASTEEYEAYMRELMLFGQAMSILKEDGKQYHVPLREYLAPGS